MLRVLLKCCSNFRPLPEIYSLIKSYVYTYTHATLFVYNIALYYMILYYIKLYTQTHTHTERLFLVSKLALFVAVLV